MNDRSTPKPTRPGEAPDDPGRVAPDAPHSVSPRTDRKPSDTLPSRHDRTGIDHPRGAEDPGPDLTGVPQT